MLAAFSYAVASCINEELTPDAPSAESGDEVQFGLSLGDPETKTIYGVEAGNAFPIYWVNGDKVRIFSPQCLDGRRSAEYQVAVSGAEQNYADRLTKTGESGLQWSKWGDNSNEFYDFYSLYPSGNYTLSNDGTKAENIVINYNQNVIVNGNVIKSDMEDCLMYAKANDVEKGDVVNLTYDPISTVVYVTLKVAAGTGTSTTDFTIQSISLVADTDIAGTFSLNVSDGTFGGFVQGKSSTTILAQITNPSTGGFYSISNGQSLSIPLFLAPIPDANVKNWKVQVVANNTTYTKTLNVEKTLSPGEIHKITLPELPVSAENWNTNDWMTNIPRNVYLSEVSLPGSWNSLNPEFQGSSPSIAAQYSVGVRAFHLDTRWASTIAPKDALFVDDFYNVSTLNPNNMYLSVADGNGGYHVRDGNNVWDTDLDQVMKQNNTSFATYLSQITEKVSLSEYMVLICSFAQESFNDVEVTGKTWMQAVTEACAQNPIVYDARNISANTLVGDVLGHVIVIINATEAISNSTVLPKDSKCFFMHLPSELTSSHFPATGYNEDKFWYSAVDDNDEVIAKASDITVYNSQTQITSNTNNGINTNRGYAPAISQRTTVLNNILEWSRSNYNKDNYAHDMWIYLGLGGYKINSSSNQVSGSHSQIAQEYNNWINNKINEMGTGDEGQEVPYYPVGISLMNFTTDKTTNISTVANTTLTSADVVQNILLLNNKYQLQFNPDYPTDYNPGVQRKSAAASYSSGMHDQNVAAFGWD